MMNAHGHFRNMYQKLNVQSLVYTIQFEKRRKPRDRKVGSFTVFIIRSTSVTHGRQYSSCVTVVKGEVCVRALKLPSTG